MIKLFWKTRKMNKMIYDKLKNELINKFSHLPDFNSGKVKLGQKFKSEEKYLDFIIALCQEGDEQDVRRGVYSPN